MVSVGQLLNMRAEHRPAVISEISKSSRLSLINLATYAIDRDLTKVEQYRKLIHELTETGATNGTTD